MSKELNLLRTVKVKRTSHLLTALMPWSGIVYERPTFRGQGDAKWELVSSVEREDRTGPSYARAQLRSEFFVLRAFMNACRRQGLSVPGGIAEMSFHLDEYELGKANGWMTHGWPSQEALPTLALAQHYGVPTRLLDWTANPFAACYFAAQQFLEMEEKIHFWADQTGDETASVPEKIAVWMFDRSAYEGIYMNGQRVFFVEPEPGQNLRLKAQSGAFMYSALWESDAQKPPGLKEMAEEELSRAGVTKPFLVKFELPSSEVGNLLEHLSQMGISGSSLYPGYEGAAIEALFETSASRIEKEVFRSQPKMGDLDSVLRDIYDKVHV